MSCLWVTFGGRAGSGTISSRLRPELSALRRTPQLVVPWLGLAAGACFAPSLSFSSRFMPSRATAFVVGLHSKSLSAKENPEAQQGLVNRTQLV